MNRVWIFCLLLVVLGLNSFACKSDGNEELKVERAKKKQIKDRKKEWARDLKEEAEARAEAAKAKAKREADEKEAARVAAGPKAFDVEVVVSVNSKKPNGKAWDALGGAPDPVIVLQVRSSGVSKKSHKVKDSFRTTHTFRGVTLAPHDSIIVDVADKDAAADDAVGTFNAKFHGQKQAKGTAGAAQVKVRFL